MADGEYVYPDKSAEPKLHEPTPSKKEPSRTEPPKEDTRITPPSPDSKSDVAGKSKPPSKIKWFLLGIVFTIVGLFLLVFILALSSVHAAPAVSVEPMRPASVAPTSTVSFLSLQEPPELVETS